MSAQQLSMLDAPKPPVLDDERRGLCLAFARQFKGQPATDVVREGVERFREKMHAEPTTVMTSYADAADLEGTTALRVEPKTFIASGHFYLKREAA